MRVTRPLAAPSSLLRPFRPGRVPVGELHFSKSHYPDSHFTFFTSPRIVIYMPTAGPTAYPHSHFWRVQELLRGGGFVLYDADRTPAKVLQPASPRLMRAWVLCVLSVAWLYGLSGFLPGRAGG